MKKRIPENHKKFKTSRVLRILGTVTICLFFFCFIRAFLQYILVDDAENYSRLTLHEMYNEEDVDILFLGSSHCFMGIDPRVIDEELGRLTFNAGTVSQQYDGSYALLKEVDRLYNIDEVYMDLYYAQGLMEDRKKRKSFDRTYLISDYMRMSLNKMEFITQSSTKENWINGFFPERRNWKNLFDYETIEHIVEQKSHKEYKEFEYLTAPISDYLGKGFVGFKKRQEMGHNWYKKHFDPIPADCITSENKAELIKIIDYCKRKDIKLTFVVVPMSDLMLTDIGNYDYYVETMKRFAKENDVEYIDFNLCKREVFTSEDSLFYDEGHLNVYGAKIFSELLAEYISGELKVEKFYDSYAQKVERDDFKILGYFLCDSDLSGERTFEIVDNTRRNEEYKVEMTIQTKEGEEVSRSLLQGYSDNKIYEIPRDEYVKLVVEHREKGTTDSDRIEYFLSPGK